MQPSKMSDFVLLVLYLAINRLTCVSAGQIMAGWLRLSDIRVCQF